MDIRKFFLLVAVMQLFLLTSTNLFAQSEVVETYYKDAKLVKETTAEKAKFKRTRSKDSNGRITIIESNVKENRVISEKCFKNDEPVGTWREYDSEGNELSVLDYDRIVYAKDTVLSSLELDLKDADAGGVEVPYFETKNSMEGLYVFMVQTIRYPMLAAQSGIQGKVFVRCSIDESGDLEVVCIERGVHPALDAEAWRVLELMPAFVPAKKDGIPVECNFSLPISFILQ